MHKGNICHLMERVIQINGDDVKILRVPYFSQSDTEHTCVVYSLKMVLDFFKNVHTKSDIRQISPNTTKDELVRVTKTKLSMGTQISDALINSLNNAFPEFIFELKQTNYQEIKKSLTICNPIIIIYNPSILDVNEIGPGHAGVVIGLNDQYIVLNNPWYGPGFYLEKTEFDRAWEIEYYRAIFIRPSSQQRLMEHAG
jgi:uncharacterized protein YvpB